MESLSGVLRSDTCSPTDGNDEVNNLFPYTNAPKYLPY